MKNKDLCLFFAPYRNPLTKRPHPSKAGVCRFPIEFPAMPNAIKPCLTPMPIHAKECEGCHYFTKRDMLFAQPLMQKVMVTL